MAKLFVTADCHFGDGEVIRVFSRPFASAAEMDRVLLENWNRTVSPNDTVIVIGDFCREPEDRLRLLQELAGTKFLVRGNHDRGGPEAGADYLVLAHRGQQAFLVHNPLHVPAGWDDWVIHGHRHGQEQHIPFVDTAHKTANVSCELTGYAPVDIDRILAPDPVGGDGKGRTG